jgi:molybdopterin-guanine dinucleotide biosynthesis protein A
MGGTGGAVLCGGASSRMGRDKALVEIGGRTMVERVCAALDGAGCVPVVVVGGDGERLAAATGRTALADAWPGEGPLGGVVVALRWFAERGDDGVVVAACDLADLTVDAVRDIAGGVGAAIALADRRHPSLARWPVAALEPLEALFASGTRSLHEALEALGAVEIPVDEAALRNVNRPADLR